MKVREVINHTRDISDEIDDAGGIIDTVFQRSQYVENVTDRLSLWKTARNEWVLVDGRSKPLTFLKLSSTDIAGDEYQSLDFIMTRPDERRKHYASTLVYAVKETVGRLIIDGAVFKGGQDLILSLARQAVCGLGVMNKLTGEKTRFTRLIDDLERCYVVESCGLKFGKQLLPEGCDFTWYDFFDTHRSLSAVTTGLRY